MKLFSIMKSPVITIGPNSTALDAANVMTNGRIGSLVVVDANGRMIGIVTERDYLSKICSRNIIPSTVNILDLASPNPVEVGPDTSIEEAAGLMEENGIRTLPIVYRKRLIGIVASRDLLVAHTAYLIELQELIKDALSRVTRKRDYRSGKEM